MKSNYFSGFCLENEEILFSEFIIKNDFTKSGFSYGAIIAFEEVLSSNTRVDLLQLFSPAFFQNKDKKYKRMQEMFYKKDKTSYVNNFLKNISYPSEYNCFKYLKEGNSTELHTLISYIWTKENLEKVIKQGTRIEVYLGSEDKIIDSFEVMDFFKKYAKVYFIKNVGHILKK